MQTYEMVSGSCGTSMREGGGVTKLNNEIALFVIGHLVDGLKEKYKDQRSIPYIDAVQKDILDNLDMFLGTDQQHSSNRSRPSSSSSSQKTRIQKI